MLVHTWSQYGSGSSLDIFEFDVLISSLRGILKDPEATSYSETEKLVALFEKASYMNDYEIIALDFSDFSGTSSSGKTIHNSVAMYFE